MRDRRDSIFERFSPLRNIKRAVMFLIGVIMLVVIAYRADLLSPKGEKMVEQARDSVSEEAKGLADKGKQQVQKEVDKVSDEAKKNLSGILDEWFSNVKSSFLSE